MCSVKRIKTISKRLPKLKYLLSFHFLRKGKEFIVNLKGLFKSPFFYVGLVFVIFFSFTCLISGNFLGKDLAAADVEKSLKNLLNSKEENLFFGQKEVLLPESPDFKIIQENSISEVSSPQILSSKALGTLFGTESADDTRREIIEYIVEAGDTLSSISEKFEISLNTLLWANSLSKNSKITPGQKLIILPISGTIHYVKSGDTISEIAKIYKGKTEEIIAFNELSDEGDIYIGDILIIPNGQAPQKPPTVEQIPLAGSYFIFPTEGKISQGLHWYNAVDIANSCGTPIYAAADGKVLKVKMTSSTSKWAFNGAGNHLTILHPNGVVTYYGHISNSFVSVGDEVYKGQKIAIMGGESRTPGAGYSTGCHLHFGVINAKNPLSGYPLHYLIKYK